MTPLIKQGGMMKNGQSKMIGLRNERAEEHTDVFNLY